MPVQITEANRNDEFLSFCSFMEWASKTVTIEAPGAEIAPGTILGRKTIGAQAVAAPIAGGANATDDAITLANPAAAVGAQAGTWKVQAVAEKLNAGEAFVLRPDGTVDGVAIVGVAYDGGVKFTIADGATDLALGDGWSIDVSYAAGSGKYVPLNLAAVDGSQNVAAVLRTRTPANTADVKNLAVTRGPFVRVKKSLLVYPAGATTNQKSAIDAQITALGIDVITTV